MQSSVAQAMYKYASSWPDKKYKQISPSSLGGCMRSHYYKLIGLPQTTPPNPGALLNFELGRLWEEKVTKGLRYMGVPFIDQFYVEDKELNCGGTLDFAVFEPETCEWTVVDSKTESVYSPMYRKRNGETFLSSNKQYVIQLATYKLLLERNGFKVSDKGRFVVITKDNGMIDEPIAHLDEKLEKVVLARIEKLNKCLEEGTVPACECEGWKVGYCNYGNPNTSTTNTKGKVVNTQCCGTPEQVESWKKG